MLTSASKAAAVFTLVAAVVLGNAAGSRAATATGDPPGTHRDWGLTWTIRAGGAGGGYGDFLNKGTAWDMDIHRQRGDWRYGVGLMFGSLAMKSPYDQEPEWAHFETFGYASRVFRNEESLRPYLQGRFAIVRSHPRSELFLKEPEEDLDDGESPTDAVNGIGLSVIPGLEFDIARNVSIDFCSPPPIAVRLAGSIICPSTSPVSVATFPDSIGKRSPPINGSSMVVRK